MRILVIRLGAWGDSIIITPLLRYLKSQGNEVYLHTSETGGELLKHNPHVDKFIPYVSDSVPDGELSKFWKKVADENGCDKIINLCESIERALSFHPMDPMYSWTKKERLERGDKNFYEYSFTHAGIHLASLEHPLHAQNELYRPEFHETKEEEEKIKSFFEQDKKAFWVLWGLSGSGLNKSYPHSDYVIAKILKHHKQVKVVTVGDELCQILEALKDKRVIRRAGVWTMRESSLATKFANLVVAPDTGLIHASGCYDTPKICLVGSNTLNNITKHFVNDYSIVADSSIVPCSPCLRQIYSASQQCPVDAAFGIPLCMSVGLSPDRVYEQFEKVIEKFLEKKEFSNA